MVQSSNERRGRKLHEKNYDGRDQWTPQSRTREEAMGRHDATRHEVSLTEDATGDRKKWRKRIRAAHPFPRKINSSLKEIYIYIKMQTLTKRRHMLFCMLE